MVSVPANLTPTPSLTGPRLADAKAAAALIAQPALLVAEARAAGRTPCQSRRQWRAYAELSGDPASWVLAAAAAWADNHFTGFVTALWQAMACPGVDRGKVWRLWLICARLADHPDCCC